MKPKKQLSNYEVWQIISKEYIGVNEICQIGMIGTSTAQKIKHDIKIELFNWLLPNDLVPTKFVLKKLNINTEEVFNKAKMEKELE